ncbi:MAG TPA: sulfotransferase [Polyangiales bacterium]|nr:sulfotransferase [Polyangiales bacterium]
MHAKRLLLFGEQRSGTLLLQSLLQAHPLIEVVPPDFDLNAAVKVFKLHPQEVMKPRQAHVLWQRMRSTLRQLPETMPAHIRCFDELLGYRMALHAASTQVVCMKFHGPFSAVADLLAADDVYCLHIVRDVRDVLLSRAFRGEQQLDEWALQWRASSASMRELAGHPRVLSVRFEDLVAAHAREAARILDWLGLDMSQLPLPAADAQGRPKLQNSSFGELSAFDARAVGRYREKKALSLVRYAQWLCRTELEHRHYPIDASLQPNLVQRAYFLRRLATVAAIAAPRRAKDAITAALLPSLAD